MRRYSPYYSPPRRGFGGRERSPPRRGYGEYGGRKGHNNGSLLVRNIPLDCRPHDLRIPFERYGPVRDVYLPRDYYTGEPRGFGFVQFVDPYDASEAQYHMNGRNFAGREITVVVASETRKRPEQMRDRTRDRGPSSYDGRRSSYYGRSRSRSVSRSRSPPRSPRYGSASRARQRSRSFSPAPRRRADYSVSPERRQAGHPRSPRDHPHETERDQDQIHNRRSYSPGYRNNNWNQSGDGYERDPYDGEGMRHNWRSPGRHSGSPSGSRSRSADVSPRRSRQ